MPKKFPFNNAYLNVNGEPIHPNAPAGAGGPGYFSQACPMNSTHSNLPHPNSPAARYITPEEIRKAFHPNELKIKGVIVAGGPLSSGTIIAMNIAATKTPSQWRRYIAYEKEVKVGGSLAWRANNPGNLRDASTKIGSVSGAVGHFAVFATLEDGRAAQRALYLTRYGGMKVKDAINKLTPPSENDTAKYLAHLKKAGVDLEKDVKSQIDTLMEAVQVNEGLIEGTVVVRVP